MIKLTYKMQYIHLVGNLMVDLLYILFIIAIQPIMTVSLKSLILQNSNTEL